MPYRACAAHLTLLALFLTLPPGVTIAQTPADPPLPSPQVTPEASPPAEPPAPSTAPESQETAKLANEDLYEKSLGAAQQALEYYGAYDDTAARERVLDIAYRLAAETHYDDYPFTFYLVDMPVPNAFALPGGQIFVTRGMLDLDLDDDMLASLLGHEIAHVTKNHGLRMQKRATLLNLLGQALIVGVLLGSESDRRDRERSNTPFYDPRREQEGGNKVQGAAAASLVLSQLLLLNYSREFEDEADDEGQRIAAAAGFDPDGARRLWKTMTDRIPLNKSYGYWRTHPFADSRMRAAETRAELLKIQPTEPEAALTLRRETQDRLLAFLDLPRKKPLSEEDIAWVEGTALEVWPRGKNADRIRLAQLHGLRDEELAKPEMARDYGTVIAAYQEQLRTVGELTPESPFLARAREDLGDLEAERRQLYPKAQEVLAGEVYETAFLETFLSNFPESEAMPQVALDLGTAYSRLRKPAEAVEQFLKVWHQAPDSDEGKRAQAGLRNLAPILTNLAALQQLADQPEDPELAGLAARRLEEIAGKYDKIADGAEYLRRYPEGTHAAAVTERLNTLAENLYTEMVVYQGVGDNIKALEAINQILAHAPLSPAAERLRERAVLEG